MGSDMYCVKTTGLKTTLLKTTDYMATKATAVKKDLNWLSQFVTVYTILYTDRINHKDLDMALYFANKAVEAARLGEGKLDPSLSGVFSAVRL